MRTRTRGRHAAEHAGRSASRELLEWVLTLGLAVGLALSIHTWVGELITVEGQSMEPTLLDHEKVLVGKVEYYFNGPKRGDIVIVKYPDRTDNIIKRVIATAGEKIAVSAGSVYINGKKLDEPYILEPIIGDFAETTVPQGTIFVMGDNRNDSLDSRIEGPISLKVVLGRAYSVVWPVDKMKKISGYQGKIGQ
jgi:signal peptidase I